MWQYKTRPYWLKMIYAAQDQTPWRDLIAGPEGSKVCLTGEKRDICCDYVAYHGGVKEGESLR